MSASYDSLFVYLLFVSKLELQLIDVTFIFQDRYGIMPDDQAICMLLNYLLNEKKYAGNESYLVPFSFLFLDKKNPKHIFKIPD